MEISNNPEFKFPTCVVKFSHVNSYWQVLITVLPTVTQTLEPTKYGIKRTTIRKQSVNSSSAKSCRYHHGD